MRNVTHTAEARENGNLVLPDAERRPRNLHALVIYTVHYELAAFAHIVERRFEYGGRAGCFNDDVETVRIGGGEGVHLYLWLGVGDGDVVVSDIKFVREVEFWAAFGCDCQLCDGQNKAATLLRRSSRALRRSSSPIERVACPLGRTRRAAHDSRPRFAFARCHAMRKPPARAVLLQDLEDRRWGAQVAQDICSTLRSRRAHCHRIQSSFRNAVVCVACSESRKDRVRVDQ